MCLIYFSQYTNQSFKTKDLPHKTIDKVDSAGQYSQCKRNVILTQHYKKKKTKQKQNTPLKHVCLYFPGSIANIGGSDYTCEDGSIPDLNPKVIPGVIGAPSSVTSIQVANLLKLFKIPQVSKRERVNTIQNQRGAMRTYMYTYLTSYVNTAF